MVTAPVESLEESDKAQTPKDYKVAVHRGRIPFLQEPVVWLVFGGLLIGLLRLAIRAASIRRLLRNSEVSEESRAREMLDLLLASQSARRPVRLLIADLDSPATVGVFRPAILLPLNWKDWPDDELHSVLAHETAHTRNQDFGWTLFAQILTTIHFLHPLFHMLTRELRLTEELSADATASESAGGRIRYATFLASMAARTDQSSRLWAAQTFLPAPRTLFRRIEMLRTNETMATQFGRTGRLGLSSALIVLMCGIAGLRAGQPLDSAQPSDTTTTAISNAPDDFNFAEFADIQVGDPQPLSLNWIPNGSLFAAGIRPAVLMQSAAFEPAAGVLQELAKDYDLDLNELDSVTIAATDPRSMEPDLLIVRSLQSPGWAGLHKLVRNPKETARNGLTVFIGRRLGFFAPDEHTFVLGTPQAIDASLQTGRRGTVNRFWHEQWNPRAGQPVLLLLDFGAFRDGIPEGQMRHLSDFLFGRTPLTQGTEQLWLDSELFVGMLTVDNNVTLDVTITSDNPKAAEGLRDTAAAVTVLFRNVLRQQEGRMARSRSAETVAAARLLASGDAILSGTTFRTHESTVTFAPTASAEEFAQSMTAVVPLLQQLLQQNRRQLQDSPSRHNLQRIAIALQYYHEVHLQFPPARSMGHYNRSGEHPVSWRVLITPFIDRADIFENYHFDEPWNSPRNAKVTSDMPEVFAQPDSAPDSVNNGLLCGRQHRRQTQDGIRSKHGAPDSRSVRRDVQQSAGC